MINIGDRVKIVSERYAGVLGTVTIIYPSGMFAPFQLFTVSYEGRNGCGQFPECDLERVETTEESEA